MAHADSKESGIELPEVNRAQSIEQIGEDTEETQSQLQIKTTKRRIVSDDKPYHYHSPNHSPQAVTCNWHMYFVGGYRILSHLLLLYCVIGVTYLLISTNNNSCTCIQKLTEHSDQQVNLNAYTVIPTALPTSKPSEFSETSTPNASVSPSLPPTDLPTSKPTDLPSESPTLRPSEASILRPSDFPTLRPSDLPTAKPSANPTKNPSDSPTFRPTEAPTSKPSESPTLRPTEAPTYEYDLYHYYVGDYKTSAQNASHSAWLLCDGSYVDSQDYGDLFEVIGHSFGAFPGYPSLFQLPDAQNRIQGIIGSNHTMGDVVGNEQMQLNETQLPSHYH
eukprot:324336_1